MSDKPLNVVWLIDENPPELRMYKEILGNAFTGLGSNVVVQGIPARPHMNDYLDLLQDRRTAAIIVDQLLNEVTGADHTGIALVKWLRVFAPKLPIYILTNHVDSDDFLGEEWNADDILSKDSIREDKEYVKTHLARLLRRVDDHRDLLGEREERFRALVKKKLIQGLDEAEQKELDALTIDRTIVTVTDEEQKLQRLEAGLKRLKDMKTRFGLDI